MALDAKTEIYGIIGWPVAHSLSPAMHNAAFQALGLNKAYVAFPVQDAAQAVQGLKALGVKGASVTIPHKQAVIPALDSIDPVAQRIGAVNTIVFDEASQAHGANTDWQGANQALAREMTIRGASVLLLGAGGSARAIGFGLLEAGARVTIASRTPDKGRALAQALGCEWQPLAAVADLRAAALINATSVGMTPEVEATPVPRATLKNFPVVMDIVYAPLGTRLLAEAAAAGCRTIDGLAMLLYQGAAQFELWTGRPAPIEVMRDALRARLK